MATLPGADVARGLGFITPDGATDLVRGRTWHSAFPRVTTWTATTPDRWDDK